MKLFRAVLALSAIIGAVSCVGVLGVEEDAYTDASKQICKCDNVVPSDCDSTLKSGLDSSDPAEVTEWLALAEEVNCGKDCNDIVKICYFSAPGICSNQGETCITAVNCCGSIDKSKMIGCENGKCSTACNHCSDVIAGQSIFDDNPCAYSTSKLLAVQACAKAKTGSFSTCPPCSNDINFDWKLCEACLQKFCSSELDACNADKP